MRKYETILVATDFSECAEHALEEAIELARRLESRIHLVHAYELPALLPGAEASAASAELDRSIRGSARTALDELAERVRSAGLQVAAEVGNGPPTEVITRLAKEHGASLVVMGTRGRSGLSHVLLGSVAERTLRTAPCPVLTVRVPE
jgi:nucleotide-binding universal stress UspA family protein